MSSIASLKRSIDKYEDAKDNIQLTIDKLEEAKIILENKNNFSVSYVDRIVNDIYTSIDNLNDTIKKINTKISSIKADISELEKQEAANNTL